MKRGALHVVFKLTYSLVWADKGKYGFQSVYVINQKLR
jgi:hypothetical protein